MWFWEDCAGLATLLNAGSRGITSKHKVVLKAQGLCCSELEAPLQQNLVSKYLLVDKDMKKPSALRIQLLAALPSEFVDIYSAGLPCQGYSMQGLRQQGRDSRFRGLILRMPQIISSIQPKLLLLEEVAAFAGSRGESAIRKILKARNYVVSTFIFNSREYVPQNRSRWYLLAVPSRVAPSDFTELRP